MSRFAARRLVRSALLALPLALTAAWFWKWPSAEHFRQAGTASAARSAAAVAGFALFWRSPREVKAMAGTVAVLQHDLDVQRLELKTTVDFLTAEREIGLVLGEDVELRAILEKVLAIVAGLLGGRPEDEIELFFRERDEERPSLKCAWAGGKAKFGKGLSRLGREDEVVEAALARGMQSRLNGGRLDVCIPLEYDGGTIGAMRIGVAAAGELDWDSRLRLLLPRFAE